MGIRVHKKIGYGLADVATTNLESRISDERINLNSPAIRQEHMPIEPYEDWLRAQQLNGDPDFSYALDLAILGDSKKSFDLESAVTHNGEFGLSNVLLIIPPSFQDSWTRYDDPMDYIEETHLREDPQANWVKQLKSGIYPFVGYMDKRTGKDLDDRIFHWVRATHTPQFKEVNLDTLAKAAGFKDHNDAVENVAPIVPPDVKNVAQFLELFTADDVWLQLRPLIYVYWS